MLRKIAVFLMIPLFTLMFSGCSCDKDDAKDKDEPSPETKLTIMYYGDGDCNLEEQLLLDIDEMKSGIVDGQGINIIALFDRIDGYTSDSSVFGEDFTDTRLYRITEGETWRLDGSSQFSEITDSSDYEANMGDPETLKKFIKFCKENYPADKYVLIFSNHGGGPKKKSSSLSSSSGIYSGVAKSICWDETDGDDFLYTSEISNTLTSDESVDLLGLDACLMSSIEFAYQFRNDSSNTGFKADIMVASAPTLWGYGWDYENIFNRLQEKSGDNGQIDSTLGGNEQYYDPGSLTAVQLGAVIVEEQRDSTVSDGSQSLACIDLSKVQAVKEAVDDMAVALNAANEKTDLESLRGDAPTANLIHYFDETDTNEWIEYPFFDLYNLAEAVNNSSNFSATIQSNAATVSSAVDAAVLYSFANTDFPGFIEEKSGIHIFFPDGDVPVLADVTGDGVKESVNLWWWQDWYNAIDISSQYSGAPLGQLAWCKDGATASNSTVENWFELLDKWFDTQTIGSTSNFNYYSY